MTHAHKVKLGRQLQTNAELRRGEDHEGIFTSRAWELRKAAIALRVRRTQDASHQRALERKGLAKPSIFTRAQRKVAELRLASQQRKQRRQAAYKAKHATT